MPLQQLGKLRSLIRKRPGITLVIALAVLACGGLLIWQNLFTTAPDAAKGDIAAATRFLSDDRFASLSSAQRDSYLASLGARYVQEPAANRQMIDAALKAKGIERNTQRSIALGMLRSILAQYRNLTPAERQARITTLRAFASAMSFTGSTVSGLDPNANAVTQAVGSEQDFQKHIDTFQRDLLNNLSAEERATLSIMAHDIHQK